jgi:hypothetical protein
VRRAGPGATGPIAPQHRYAGAPGGAAGALCASASLPWAALPWAAPPPRPGQRPPSAHRPPNPRQVEQLLLVDPENEEMQQMYNEIDEVRPRPAALCTQLGQAAAPARARRRRSQRLAAHAPLLRRRPPPPAPRR